MKYRINLIPRNKKESLHKYITGIVQNRGAKMIAINSMPDHIHLLIGFRPVISVADLVKEIKVETNELINREGWIRSKFQWQEGYGVFSYSQSHIGRVAAYIQNQEIHHQRKSFRSEYVELLDRFEIPYKEKYLFDFIE